MGRGSKKLITNNKKARFDYFILEAFETGIELFGTKVKALRVGHCFVKESWVDIRNGEIFICGMRVNPYEKGNIFNKDPFHVRKLLMHKGKIRHLIGTIKEKGFMFVPLEVYLEGRLVKMETSLAQGKKKYDEHTTIAKNDMRRDLERNSEGSVRY